MAGSRIVRMLTENRARTDPSAQDPALRGRTYAIPFDRVWSAIIALADGGLDRWRVVRADASAGTVEAEARTRFRNFVDDVRIRIGLDREGWTRLDMESASRVGRGDLGANRRRIRRFLLALDGRLGVVGGETATGPVTASTPRHEQVPG